ncbi:MAG: hydrogenase maturation factor [Firmicutes bacterium HGW-Firmicutes-3]|nr:MAG: hydrogenase maturation factor [Firmicutes bacterium HGW-Firmicutes-3]
MEIGKVSETVLKRTILKPLSVKREEVIHGPGIGEDCCVLKFPNEDLIVMSTDPITGTTKEIGKLAVHVTANDIASSGATLVGILLTILLPKGFLEEDLKIIMQDVNEVCTTLNVQVLGGHTEVTGAVNQPIVSVTGIGRATDASLAMSCNLDPGDDLVMTKWAGIEGTGIIALEKEAELRGQIKESLIEEAKKFTSLISVVEDSAAAMKHGVKAMHDITEGGVYGALWEMAASAKVGFEVQLDSIPIRRETIEICEFYGINPYQLISSGALLIGTQDGPGLVKVLGEAGIHSAHIGKVTSGKQRLIISDQIRQTLKPPQSDELYKVIK